VIVIRQRARSANPNHRCNAEHFEGDSSEVALLVAVGFNEQVERGARLGILAAKQEYNKGSGAITGIL
jgi:hypothetical protein